MVGRAAASGRQPQRDVVVSIGDELFWAWEDNVLDPLLSWRNLVSVGSKQRDVTVQMKWEAKKPGQWVRWTRDRAAGRGLWQWEWYIVAARVLKLGLWRGESGGADGVGAVLPPAPMGV